MNKQQAEYIELIERSAQQSNLGALDIDHPLIMHVDVDDELFNN